MATIQIRKPFDTHVHGRQGMMLRAVAPLTARQCWGAIFEPNTLPPITTKAVARAYADQIRSACEEYPDFKPFVLAYFTDDLNPEELADGLADGSIFGLKFYPRGATTNSGSGILDVRTLWEPGSRQYEVIRAMANAKRVIQLHGELNFDLHGNELDPYDKEAYFYGNIFPRLLDAHPDTRWSLEHITTAQAAGLMVTLGGPTIGCSITPHHLLLDRRDMFRGGLRPDLFCLPVIKASEHSEALMDLAARGLPFVYAGSDSAPHDRRNKYCDCCSGGVFSAHAMVEFYAEAFYRAGKLNKLEDFLSVNGPTFYGLEPSAERITLIDSPWTMGNTIQYNASDEVVVPFGYKWTNVKGEAAKLTWKLSQ